jgi:hypothetical protein
MMLDASTFPPPKKDLISHQFCYTIDTQSLICHNQIGVEIMYNTSCV